MIIMYINRDSRIRNCRANAHETDLKCESLFFLKDFNPQITCLFSLVFQNPAPTPIAMMK